MELLYTDVAPFYHLITAPHEYVEEAAAYHEAIERAAKRKVKTLLELGCGGGCNASHLAAHYQCVLTDISPAMLAESRKLNPSAEHLVGDMRTLRLGRELDAVLVHDAVCYMTTEDDLARVFETAFLHCAPGGVALVAPDYTKETLELGTEHGGNDAGDRGAHYLAWVRDPDPEDTTYVVDYAFLLREGDVVRAVHDRHVEGLFPRATWVELLRSAGFDVEVGSRPVDEGGGSEVFVAVKPL